MHLLDPRLPVLLDALGIPPVIPFIVQQRPSVINTLASGTNSVRARHRPNRPADIVLQSEILDAVHQCVIEQGRVLRPAELGHDNRHLAHGIGTVVDDVASFGLVDAEGIEAIAVQLSFDDVAVTRVLVLGHGVHVQFVEDLVRPRVLVKVEDDGVQAIAVADGIALVARCDVQVQARSHGGEVLVELHAGPGDEDVRVHFVDGVCSGGVVADEVGPVVAELSIIEGAAEFVAEGHRDDVGVTFGPVCDVAKTSVPVLDVEFEVAEPGVAVCRWWLVDDTRVITLADTYR